MEEEQQVNYKEFLKGVNLVRTRVGCLLGCILTFASILLDYLTNPEHLARLFLIRAYICAFMALLYGVTFTPTGKKYVKIVAKIVALSLGFAIALMIRELGGYETPYYAGLNLIILFMALLMPWEAGEIAFISLSIYSFYLVPILLFDDITNSRIFFNNNIFILETIVIAIASGYFTARLRFNEFSARFELEKARDELKELDELKSQLFSKVSHELRTPLANIMLPIQNILAKRGQTLDPENKQEKEAMLRNARRLMKRINEILDIAKLEAGKMKIRAKLSDINRVLHDIVVASSIGAKEMGLDLTFESRPTLSRIYVDVDMLEKVFANLISNALKFTNRGGKVNVKTRETENHVVVSVNDTGIGIPKDGLIHIFDRFQQMDSSSSRKYEGTGLGLTLVKELVDLHHGSVKVASKLGQGTIFTVYLQKGKEHYKKEEIQEDPKFETTDGFKERRLAERRGADRREEDRRKMAAEDRDTIDSLQVQLSDLGNGAASPEEASNGEAEGEEKKKNVLVVEDNKDLAGNIAKSLADIYNIFVAYNGRQGLDRVAQKMPDLIISDVMMPEMDGFEFCEKIKSDEQTQHIPIILLTARATTDDKIEGLKHGADQYLAKPFNPNELRAVADSLLAKKELEGQLNKSNLELKKTLHELEEAQVQLVHTARLESVGQLAAGIAHEIKNNIYCVRAGLDGINKRLALLSEGKLDIESTYGSLEKALKTNNEAIESSLFIVNSLLDFSGKDKKGMSFHDVNEGIESTLAILLPRIQDKVTVHRAYGELTKAECRIEEINQVIMNLMLNAYQAIEKAGTVRIETVGEEDEVRISIADDGPGIPEENLDKIFSPFFSTKEKDMNTGLGLSICYNIIKAHHGTINAKSAPGQGTEFIVTLPIKQPKS